MKIDAHQHFWPYNPEEYGWISEDLAILKRDFMPADLEPILQQNGIDGCIAVQARQSLEETRWLLELADQHSFIKGVVGWVDLCSEEVEDQLAQYSKNEKLVGVRHVLHDEEDDDFMLRKDFLNGLSKLSKYDLTYDILIFPKHLKNAYQLVRQFPDQKFIIDHIAKPSIKTQDYAQWKVDMWAFKGLPNVWCKVSGMVTEADWNNIPSTDFNPVLDHVFETFSQDKLLYGSDWPVCKLAAEYSTVKGIVENYLEENAHFDADLIMGNNCVDFYGITQD